MSTKFIWGCQVIGLPNSNHSKAILTNYSVYYTFPVIWMMSFFFKSATRQELHPNFILTIPDLKLKLFEVNSN